MSTKRTGKQRLTRRRPIQIFLLGLLLVGLAAFLIWDESRQPSTAVNVILVTVDTLRADHLNLYGYGRETSPNLARFAAGATVFEHAYAHSPSTAPSLSALFTSHYSHETGVPSNRFVLPAGATTVTEILKQKGYRTGAVIGNPVLHRGAGFEQGFDDYDDHMEELSSLGYERKAEQNTRAAIAWLEQHRQERFFLWVHYMDPHGPYTPPPPYDGMFLEPASDPGRTLRVNQGFNAIGGIPEYQVLGDHREFGYYLSQYDAEIRYCDQWLGELLTRIRDLNLLNNSLIVVTSDHGEGLGEHEYFFSHKDFLHEELLRVPLIVWTPGLSSKGRRIERQVGLIDVVPEILRVTGAELPKGMLGKGLFAASDGQTIFAETMYRLTQATLFSADLKLIREEDAYLAIDRKRDPKELHNLMQDDIDPQMLGRIKRLKEELQIVSMQDTLALGAPTERPMLAAMKDKLKALGYVQ